MTTLNLVQRLLKKLSHLPTSYHLSSHLITPYPIYFRENYSFVTTLSLLPKLFKKLSHLVTAYDTLSHLNPTPLTTSFQRPLNASLLLEPPIIYQHWGTH